MKLTSPSEHTLKSPAHTARVGSTLQTLAAILFLPALVALATLLPRLAGLADFFTTDEAHNWIRATGTFAYALSIGRWKDTNLIGHPGVTLMWLGTLGLHLERVALNLGLIGAPDRLEHLAWLRLGPVLAHTLLTTASYLLLRRLVRPSVALVAALLWATSPFLVAQGRLLHLDALLTGFTNMALLCTLHACYAPRPTPWLLAVGVFTGLALLTKGPALIMLPVLGLIMFALTPSAAGGRLFGGQAPAQRMRLLWQRMRWAVPRYVLVLAVAAVTILLLWPALWVAPAKAIGDYMGEIITNGGRPNGHGQFFLGRDDPDPGPLFYLVAGLYRLTPLELLGLVLLPFVAWRSQLKQPKAEQLREGQTLPENPSPILKSQKQYLKNYSNERAVLMAMGAFALFWMLAMTLGPKKFDRYILPAWPALLTFSAVGLVAGWEWLRKHLPQLGASLALGGLLLLQGGSLAWYHPYHLSYFNPLLGGGRVAPQMFLIGWGEGMREVGAWLSARPDIQHGQIISALPPNLEAFVPVPVQEIRALATANPNYAVVYLESLQRGDVPEIYARIQQTLPLHVVRLHGIDYAWIHQLPRPFSTPVGADFAATIRLLGFTAHQEGALLTITPAWDVRGSPTNDLLVFLHLYNQQGERVAQVDVAPGGAARPATSQWQPGEQIGVPLPLALPSEIAAGSYTLVAGLYDPASGQRLPLTNGPPADPALAGPDAAFLGQIELVWP
ncbi:MAG: phospholipid carrier-dependent glycosyltransferase [Candidatus Viridilinea halotolerans]|uniref:Phospholipid carrier-dependent glycosyltransferase n=1 Tax=Candidatus Viridilinea halotolerans TaxID=2491704 RepID=A0A426TZN5_9CHLR|nr:MAG: phospholipid carrier-dependent glycosyltransferase [Candidatus Viridilinea halotolerans]